MHAITIAARNYLPMARTVAESFAAANPDDHFTILLVDAEPGEITGTPEYDIATPQDLSLSASEFGRMAFLYDVTELSTALKPWGLEMLLDRGAEVAVYLDPDIFVYDSMHQIEVESLAHGIVLTPHTLTPMPRDGLRPTEADIMGSGIYNLGFIAVRKTERHMLTWWQERLSRDSISAPEQMLFTDQRWIDMVPGYYPHTILRDPGYNVAYWNLDSRAVTKDGEQYRVNGEPLRFFHFSGYSPAKPWVLSKYVADKPRVVLSEHPVVRELCDGYAEVVSANGPLGVPPYRYNRFSDGTPIVPGLRRMYRQAVIDAELEGIEPPPAPFTPDGHDEQVLDWFRERVVSGSWVTRAAYALWLYRSDLQTAFPDVFGINAAGFLSWCLSSGIEEGSLVASLLPSDKAEVDTSSATKIPGVNLVGYFRTETGVGQIGRLLADAVKATGLPYSTIAAGPTVSRENAEFEDSTSDLLYPINVVSVNADQLPTWANGLGADVISGRYTIGVWAWEVEDFPAAFDPAIELVDEIWAISSFVQTAIQGRTNKPVHVIPYEIPEITTAESLDRAALGLPDRPYFLFMFDYLSVFARKNPLGVIKAFIEAFEDAGEGPILVIKSVNGGRFRSQREELRNAVAGHPDIHLLEDYLDYGQVEALVADSLAYVSLHRAEGLGLTLSESMSAGKPVIATKYSGNLDFMDDKNSLLIPYELTPIGPGAEPYGPPTRWAEPDLHAAARAMRWVYDNPEAAAELGERARESVRSTFDLDRSAAFVAGRVRQIVASGALSQVRPSGSAKNVAELIEQHQQLLNQVPDVDGPSRYPGVPLMRRAVRKVLSHHDEQVNVRLNALLDATRALARRQSELEAEVADRRLVNIEVTRNLEATVAGLRELQAEMAEAEPRSREHEARLSMLGSVLDISKDTASAASRLDTLAERASVSDAKIESHQRQFADVVDRLDSTKTELTRLDAEITARPFQADPEALRMAGEDGRTVLGYHAEASEQANYADFEDVFRGSEEFIEGRLVRYLDLVRDRQPVLDIGCGRGEFVRLLQKNGVEVRGVDNDRSMVERAQASGLNVEFADGISAIRAADESSLGSITSFQVIEHLELAVLRNMFQAGFAALQPGGVFIAETVNPHSLPALKTFWLDLTHIRPLFPESMLFLAREMGFASAEILFPQGTGELDADMRTSGEYAIIARKA